MNKTIELNEQQIETLVDCLSWDIEHGEISETQKVITQQIISKLEQE